MILDIVTIAVIAIFAIVGYRRGIAGTVLNIVGFLAAAFLSVSFSQPLSEYIYNSLVQPVFVENIEQAIKIGGAEQAIDNCLLALPEWVNNIVSPLYFIFGFESEAQLSNEYFLHAPTQEVVNAIENAVGQVVIDIFSLILQLILFLVIYLIIKQVIKFVLKFFSIPVISQINAVLGGILGVVEGLIIVFIAVNLLYAFVFSANPIFVSNQMVNGMFYKMFCLTLG